MKKKLYAILLTLCVFAMPAFVSAEITDKYEISSDTTLSEDATYGSLRITNNATLTIEQGVTLTIDGSNELTSTGNKNDTSSALALLTDGNIVLKKGATLNIVNAKESVYAAFRTTGNSNVTLNEATLNVSDNDTRGMDNTMGLTLTMTSSTLKVNNNTLNGMNGTTGPVTATDSKIEAIGNKQGGGLSGKFILKGNTTVNASENGLSGITFADGSIISGTSTVEAYDNNTTNNVEKADVIVTKNLTINEKGGISATTVAPMKTTWGSLNVLQGSKIVIDGEEAVAIIGLYNQLCDGAATDSNCDQSNLVSSSNDLKNGVLITMNEDLEMVATIAGTVNDGLELPKEVTKVIIEDSVTKDVSIVVAEKTTIENNSNYKVNAKVGESTITIESGKTMVVEENKDTTTPVTDEDKDTSEILPPKTGDINLFVILSVIVLSLGLTGFVGKKIYAKIN